VSDNIDDFVVSGLLKDPNGPNAAAEIELLDYLVNEVGASIPELVRSNEQGGILSFAAFRALREEHERFTIAEAAKEADVSPEFAAEIWRCAGFAEPRPFERRFGQADVEMFRAFAMIATFVPEELVLQLTRTIGEAMLRVAEAEVALLRSNVEAPLVQSQNLADVARTYRAIASEVFPRIAQALDSMHRHHLQAIGRRYSEVGAPTSALNVVQLAVGFADLAGYTGLWEEREPDELARMISAFEAITGDVIVSGGANVVKRIGDAVMFVTNAPGVSCALALELLEACQQAGLPKLRVGVAFGDVMVRQGDFFGPVVNLAARLVGTAEAGTALTDIVMYERLRRVRGGYTFLPAGKITLAGFVDPVETYQLLRP
jgi:adenylate cyclase